MTRALSCCTRAFASRRRALCLILIGMMASGGFAHAVHAEHLANEPPVYNAKNKRDPFVPLVRDGKYVGVVSETASADSTTPFLIGILWDQAGQSIAMINDGEYKVGDTVADYQVAEIRQDAVVLKREAESLVLQINFDQASKSLSGSGKGGKHP